MQAEGINLGEVGDIEELISSMLSSDTRSVDDDPNEISNSHSIDDSDNGSGASITHKHGQTNSEYSDLNMDEKLNALLAFVDILRACQYINRGLNQLVISFDLEQKYFIHVPTCRDNSDSDMFPKHKILSSQLHSLKAAAYTLEASYC
ncbi:hypothetical protein Tco_0093379 [Tanacetum coccineum]